jgi:hypothetical protein
LDFVSYWANVVILLSLIILIISYRKRKYNRKFVQKKLSFQSFVIRAFLGGLIISISVIISNKIESSLGGYIASFPVSFLININLIFYSSGRKILDNVFNTVPQGTLSLIFFSICFYSIYGLFHTTIVLILSLFISCLFLFLYSRYLLRTSQ